MKQKTVELSFELAKPQHNTTNDNVDNATHQVDSQSSRAHTAIDDDEKIDNRSFKIKNIKNIFLEIDFKSSFVAFCVRISSRGADWRFT